ncbi:mono/diheme cytochrome c family protein [Altererythrobacter atlanticus]|uniref:Cytochrome c6 n=1 Tax=Croceibacterium atlanticum TaxID=1267766 RepID=A0A0F7KWT7_9SPHN|nr:cytochrome c [Croceibacterium atlanticum]AKH44134.1 Cytochrome c6 [Croceibacterium atlanticum]MBB5732444.1 mono/diheme cytochrome c family protein [Croceibacterium atlanticum]
MTRWTIIPALALLGACSSPMAQEVPQQGSPKVVKADLPGRTIFEHQCAPCHGAGPGDDGMPMLPGTMALARKYDGALPAALELRSDLGPEVLELFVRKGSGAMPMFRKAELTDADISAIAEYLQATAEASGSE